LSQFAELYKRLSNWGRWGPEDEAGTLNLIDAAAVQRGLASVRTGQRLTLGIPLDDQGPQLGFVKGRVNPLRTMIAINEPWNDDIVTMALQAGTHWDALAHMSYEGSLYNGFGADTVTAHGASRCGIDKAPPIVTRGVLLDVARAKRVERLEGGTAVTADDLDAAAELAEVTPEAGDVVLVRTGQIQLFHAGDRPKYPYPSAGLGMSAAEWMHSHDVAAVATDNYTFEVIPCEIEEPFIPVHILHLVAMGLTQGQNWDLEELSAACAADGDYTFLLDATPQPFTGGLGSPVNPVVIR
jgi:kynurenine formamidase